MNIFANMISDQHYDCWWGVEGLGGGVDGQLGIDLGKPSSTGRLVQDLPAYAPRRCRFICILNDVHLDK